MKQTNFLSLLFFLAILPLAIYFQRYLLNKSTFSEPKLGFEPGLIRTKEKEDNGTDFPGANPLQYQYPNNITGTYNATFFLIDFPRNVLGGLLPKGRELLPLTEIRKTLPHQKNGTSPLLVRIGLDEDVHSGSVVAGSNFDFHNAHVSIPFVDQSKDMKTGFIYDLFLATSSASSINLTLQYSQEKATLADFYPSSQAFIQTPKVSPSSSSSYFASAKGHNSSSPIYELQYSEISSKEQQSSSVSIDSVKSVVNQGQFQLGNCTYDDQMWNLPFSNPHVIRADYLNLYYPFVPKALAGIYDNVYGVRVPQGGFIERVNSVCQSEA